MLERTQSRALPLLSKGVDFAPAVNACCGACRACVTTNLLTLATAAVSGAAVWLLRLGKRS